MISMFFFDKTVFTHYSTFRICKAIETNIRYIIFANNIYAMNVRLEIIILKVYKDHL